MSRHVLPSIMSLAIAVITLTACSSQVGGQASPSASSPAATRSTPTTADPSNPFAGMNPCTMLDQLLSGQGFPPAAPSLADKKHACDTTRPVNDPKGSASIGLGLYPGQKVNENINNPAKAKPGTIDASGRPVVLQPEPLNSSGQCQINLQVATNSRMDVLVTSGLDTERACKMAGDLAEKVDPLLPKA
ncbi:DUF3558 family protein [Amycolatopsis sp. NPDC058986]|uniref:DUF3558 family protein n=2 Tax=Amycolatopsis TaxID=1813 RepID=UPI0036733F28